MYISKEERIKLKESFKALREAEEDSVKNDGQVPVEDDNITVEVDGKIVTDTPVEEEPIEASSEESTETSVDNFGPKLGIVDMLLQAVNDENSTIQFYNNLIAVCNEEGFEDIANIIKHINEEENIHVGMLQHAMTTISDQAKDINKGVEEAEAILAGDLEVKHEDSEEESSAS